MKIETTDGKELGVTSEQDGLYDNSHLVRLTDEAYRSIWLTPREARALAALLLNAADTLPAPTVRFNLAR